MPKEPPTASSGLTPFEIDIDLALRADALLDNTGGVLDALLDNTGGVLDALLDNTGGVLDVSLLPQIKPPAGDPPFAWGYSLLGVDHHSPDLHLIVLAATRARAYWSEPLGAGDVFPNCASRDAITGIGNPGGKCNTCPMSEWGSAARFDDDRAQACREFRVLPALVLPSLTMTLVRVPPTSVRAVDAYVQDLALAGHRVSHMVTRASLVPEQSSKGVTFATVKLEAVGKVEDPAHLKALAQLATIVRSASVGSIVAETTLDES